MSSRRDHGSGTPSNASNRQNEYFIPRDGIDREVITADICRYLGNDALVRPGTYEDKKTGRVIQGYFVTAYRNLTSAMIADLKADSARWEQERRNHSGARYSDSQNRFSGAGLSQYPGSDAPGYSASTGSQPYHQDNTQPGYNAQYQQAAYSTQAQDPRFAPTLPSSGPGYVGQTYSNHPTAAAQNPYYGGAHMLASQPSQPSSRSQQPQPQEYPDSREASSVYPRSSYGGPGQPFYSPSQGAYPPQPVDAFAGRQPYGSTSQAEYLGSSQAPVYDRQYEPQYENQTPPPSRPVASSSSQAQTGHSGTSHSRRSDRERDRDDRPRRR